MLLVIVGCVAWTGCAHPRRTLLREDIRTVYVPVFDNTTWHRGLEVALTRAVTEELKLYTHLRFVSREEADSVLEGKLVAFEESKAKKSRMDEILVITVSAEVEFHWVDNRTGNEIVPRQTIRESGRHVTAGGEPLERLVFRKAAQRIVEKMHRDW